jgi:hypothetical protein
MPMARRTVTAEEAEALVAEWRMSKRALPSWCASRGIDGRSRRHRVDRLDRAPLRLLDVTPSGSPRLRLFVEDVVVEVGEGFLPDTLARVLAVVRPPSPPRRRPPLHSRRRSGRPNCRPAASASSGPNSSCT